MLHAGEYDGTRWGGLSGVLLRSKAIRTSTAEHVGSIRAKKAPISGCGMRIVVTETCMLSRMSVQSDGSVRALDPTSVLSACICCLWQCRGVQSMKLSPNHGTSWRAGRWWLSRRRHRARCRRSGSRWKKQNQTVGLCRQRHCVLAAGTYGAGLDRNSPVGARCHISGSVGVGGEESGTPASMPAGNDASPLAL